MKYGNYEYVSNKEFWDFYIKNSDNTDLLKYNIEKHRRNDLFNKYVTVVNLEVSSFCNRKCDYCPVADLVSKTKEFMQEDKFETVRSQLNEINFSGIITMNLFNEPLANPEFFIKRLKLLRSACPNSYIRINTNGDYLTKDLLHKIKDAGINEILVTLHKIKSESYDDVHQMDKINSKIDSLGLREFSEFTNYEENKNITYEIRWQNIRLLIVSNNWSVYGVDRGGTVKKLSIKARVEPCLVPFREVTIDFNGYVLWCWNIFRDENYSFGNLKDSSLVDIYFSESAVDLRRKLITNNEKEGICRTCNVSSYTNDNTEENRDLILEAAS